MKELQYISLTEKIKTREVWEEIFQEDSKAFLDYYYSEKIKNNEVLVLADNTMIYSMLHLNPYEMQCHEKIYPIAYVVAVATKEEFRHQKMMQQVLCKAMQDACRKKMPFLFLMPADEKIYKPYGFTFVYQQNQTTFCMKDKPQTEFYIREIEQEDDLECAAEFAENILKNQLHTVRNKEYYAVLQKECASESGKVVWICDKEKKIGLICFTADEEIEVRELLLLQEYEERYADMLQDIFGTYKKEIKVYGMSEALYDKDWHDKKKVNMIMLRIADVCTFLSLIRTEQEEVRYLKVLDPWIEENNKCICWKSGPDYSEVFEITPNESADMREAKIEEIQQWILGQSFFINEVV